MQFDITVIQVTEELAKKNAKGGTFNACQVVYKRDGKVEAKSFPDWANKEIYDTLKGLTVNGNYTVTTEKVGDFWKWLEIHPTTNTDTASQQASAPNPAPVSKTGTGKVLGSNYETKEERAQRQKLIVAQSSLSAAIEFAKALEPKGSTQHINDTLANAEQFYNWVFSVTIKDLSDIESDIPQ